MKTKERELANKIAAHWYDNLHMQHAPIFQKQKLADFVETELKTLGLFSVVFSDQKERSRFQKDIDDCYAHEDEEENEAEVCLSPTYIIIGCEYNDGRPCHGCKWLPKQT